MYEILMFMFQKYLYESRHRHALNRSRGSGGVFVQQKGEEGTEHTNGDHKPVINPQLMSTRDLHIPIVTQSSELVLGLDT